MRITVRVLLSDLDKFIKLVNGYKPLKKSITFAFDNSLKENTVDVLVTEEQYYMLIDYLENM